MVTNGPVAQGLVIALPLAGVCVFNPLLVSPSSVHQPVTYFPSASCIKVDGLMLSSSCGNGLTKYNKILLGVISSRGDFEQLDDQKFPLEV